MIIHVSKDSNENGCVYKYDRVTLLYSRNYHTLANQLHFDKTLKKWKKKELRGHPIITDS